MFKRRRKRTLLENLREVFWPEMGWIRATFYAKHRLLRLSSTTHKIATGLACGACVSFTPFFGFHFLMALAYSWLLGGQYLAAIIGTFWGNPWTFPFMFMTSFKIGTYVLSLFGYDFVTMAAFHESLNHVEKDFYQYFIHYYVPTALGGVICMVLFFPVFYLPSYLMIRSAKAARQQHLRRKWKKKWEDANEKKEQNESLSAADLQTDLKTSDTDKEESQIT